MTDVARRSHPGRGPGSLATGAALALLALPAAARAGAWEDFAARCLAPMADQAAPVTAGPGAGRAEGTVTRHALAGGRVLVLERAPDDGFSACAVIDPAATGSPEFDAWIAAALDKGRYVPVGAGRWQSHEWIEPVLEIQKHSGAQGLMLRIVETRLEALKRGRNAVKRETGNA